MEGQKIEGGPREATVPVARRRRNVRRPTNSIRRENRANPMGDRTGDERAGLSRASARARVRSVIDGNGSPTQSVIIIDLNDDPSDSYKPIPPVAGRHSAVRRSFSESPERRACQSINSVRTDVPTRPGVRCA